jgi:hypothetical protein
MPAPKDSYYWKAGQLTWAFGGVPHLLMINYRLIETLVSGSPVDRGPEPALRGGWPGQSKLGPQLHQFTRHSNVVFGLECQVTFRQEQKYFKGTQVWDFDVLDFNDFFIMKSI